MFLEQLEGQELAGRFLLLRLVGQGGYGAVFEAEQISVGRRCAVKVLLPDQCENEAIARRFAVEARAISQLVHSNSVILYDFGQSPEHNQLLYLAMEFLEGQDLNQLIESEGQLGLETTVHIARQIGGSLHEAHMQGLVHRDVKPHNVMLINRNNDPYFVKVIDFGIAKALQSSRLTMQELTQAGTMIGTPHYMAPEQVLDRAVDGRTDQYSLATTIYKMLAGRTPFQGVTAIEVASKQLNENPLPVSTYRKDLQNRGTIDSVLLRALSKKPGERYADVMEFVEAFAAATLMQNDLPYYGEASTLVDAPAPSAKELVSSVGLAPVEKLMRSQEDVLPATIKLESITADTGMTVLGDDRPGATLFITQGFHSAEIEDAVEERSTLTHGRLEQLTEPPVQDIVEIRDDVKDKHRDLPASIAFSLENHKWLLGVTLAVSCVFLMLFGLVVGQVLLSRIKAKNDDGHVVVADQGAVEIESNGASDHIASGSHHGGGPVLDRAQALKSAIEGNEKAGEALALFVVERARWHVSVQQEQERIALRQRAAAKATQEKPQIARVRVTLIPWGRLYVNRKAYSDKPRQELRLAPGRYTFTLMQGDNEKVRKTVDVKAGSNTMVELVAK